MISLNTLSSLRPVRQEGPGEGRALTSLPLSVSLSLPPLGRRGVRGHQVLRELGRSGDQEGPCFGPETNTLLSLSGTQVFSLMGQLSLLTTKETRPKGRDLGLGERATKAQNFLGCRSHTVGNLGQSTVAGDCSEAVSLTV